MVTVPDRSGPRADLLGNSALNAAPAFPFYICPANGHFESPISLVSTDYVEIDFTVPDTQNFELGDYKDSHQFIFGFFNVDTTTVLLCTNAILVYDDQWNLIEDAITDTVYLVPGRVYRARVRTTTDSVQIKYYDVATGEELSVTITASVLTAGAVERTLYLGYPTDAILAAETYDSTYTQKAALDAAIVAVLPANPGPDAFCELVPQVIATAPRYAGQTLGRVVGRHPRGYEMTYSEQAGDDAALFNLVGDRLVAASNTPFTASTIYTYNVRVYDKFGWTLNVPIHPVTGPALPPTLLELSNLSVTAPVQAVGDFVTTAGMTGDVFTYSLVEGDGSSNNTLFSITADALSFIDPSTEGTYSCRVRATSTYTGLFVDAIFEIAVGT